ncbi:squalene--hopene cyclase [Sutcliffiella horikoshii]|uniref:squalene--hopene cyclase n=1 Tax=Sutcliffiella horikoshii TaxID=79883 RepID=UPI00203E6C4A|nr:squalene--hopene cyclase [Sutcliffiella horikoshii]MCM3619892.1 squalene--hopene cyclase [Sutcliffiella horikoshii]
MKTIDHVNASLNELIREILGKQSNDGSWNFCFEGSSIMTDAYMIILIKTLNRTGEEQLVKRLVKRILSKQTSNGSWKAFKDENEGNLSATIEGYFSLLYSGYVTKDADLMQKAERFIQNHGGLAKSDWLTKMMLALNGQIKWPAIVKSIPIEIMAVPKWAPVNIYHLVGYARAHWIPIIICSNLDASFVHSQTPNMFHLQSRETPEDRLLDGLNILSHYIKNTVKKLAASPVDLRRKALINAENYILDRIEDNGTLYSYFSASFFMIYSLMALGYEKDHPIIENAFLGMKSYLCRNLSDDSVFLQNSPSTVWDTALLTGALINAGVPIHNDAVTKAGKYLLSRQHDKYGDWAVKNPDAPPGGWGFSDINTIVPDIDDTAAALRVITPLAQSDERYKESWNKGVQWLLSMQNDDGGWSAFEKNTDNYLLSLIPFRYEDRVLFDPSTADLTGRAMYFLGECTTIAKDSNTIAEAIKWLEHHQQNDGSWYGRWGNCYIYGTWAAVTGLKAVGVPSPHSMIRNAVNWLNSIQNSDGGWGESCSSDIQEKYVPLHHSTPSQTAWALDALIASSETPTPQIEKGVHALTALMETSDWRTEYPTGGAIPGGYYINYHSYKYIWPLQALGNYRKKYGS